MKREFFRIFISLKFRQNRQTWFDGAGVGNGDGVSIRAGSDVIDFGDKNSIYRNKVLDPDLHINIQDDYRRIY